MWGHRILDPSRWGARQKILAAMLGILVAIAITAVVAMCLAPPNMSFCIQHPSLNVTNTDGNRYILEFDLVARNTGLRMEAHYDALQTEIWINATLWLPAKLFNDTVLLKAPQLPKQEDTVHGSAEYLEHDQMIKPGVTAGEAETWPNCTVVVMARVFFSYGIAYTRPYSIRVACQGINFLDKTPTSCTRCDG